MSYLSYLFSNEPPIGNEVHESENKSLQLQAMELWEIVREEPLSSMDDLISHYRYPLKRSTVLIHIHSEETLASLSHTYAPPFTASARRRSKEQAHLMTGYVQEQWARSSSGSRYRPGRRRLWAGLRRHRKGKDRRLVLRNQHRRHHRAR